MKGLIRGLSLISILFLSHAMVSAQEKETVGAVEEELKGTVTLSGAWAIYPTAVAWGTAFQALHPKVKVDVSAGGAGKGAADAIAGLADIGMVSRDPDPAEIKKGIVPIYILHDAIFPMVSEKNPALGDLLKKRRKEENFDRALYYGNYRELGCGSGQQSRQTCTRLYTIRFLRSCRRLGKIPW